MTTFKEECAQEIKSLRKDEPPYYVGIEIGKLMRKKWMEFAENFPIEDRHDLMMDLPDMPSTWVPVAYKIPDIGDFVLIKGLVMQVIEEGAKNNKLLCVKRK